jgi:hypothetical protein
MRGTTERREPETALEIPAHHWRSGVKPRAVGKGDELSHHFWVNVAISRAKFAGGWLHTTSLTKLAMRSVATPVPSSSAMTFAISKA